MNKEFEYLGAEELTDILGLTIKKDNKNKLITFLCALSAYTEDSQFNLIFNAPSSTGKSFIPTEIAKLFPAEDVIEIAYCSPTAFFHENGKYDKERNSIIMELSNKIIIFLDQPHLMLLEKLRPLLSHDAKEINLKITDKSQKGGLKTKNIIIKGYPSVIFCSANMNIDEQEGTRFMVLSPEVDQDKLRESIREKVLKDTDIEKYATWLEQDPRRIKLRERILAIKAAKIKNIIVPNPEIILEKFFASRIKLKPRHQRDVGRIISLIKVSALINLWLREKVGPSIISNNDDLDLAFLIWNKISKSQELNISPYILDIYEKIILPLSSDNHGLTKKEILAEYYKRNGSFIPDNQLRQQIIPTLKVAGLISEDPDPKDGRSILIRPTMYSE